MSLLIIKVILKRLKIDLFILILFSVLLLISIYLLSYSNIIIKNIVEPYFAFVPSDFSKERKENYIKLKYLKTDIKYYLDQKEYVENVYVVGIDTSFVKKIPISKNCYVDFINLNDGQLELILNPDCNINDDKVIININNKNLKCDMLLGSLNCDICNSDITTEELADFLLTPYKKIVKKDIFYYTDNFIMNGTSKCKKMMVFQYKYGRILSAISKVMSDDVKYIMLSDVLALNFLKYKNITDIELNLKINNTKDTFYLADIINTVRLKENISIDKDIYKFILMNIKQFDNLFHNKGKILYLKFNGNSFSKVPINSVYINTDKYAKLLLGLIVFILIVTYVVITTYVYIYKVLPKLVDIKQILDIYSLKTNSVLLINIITFIVIYILSIFIYIFFKDIFEEYIYSLSNEFFYYILPFNNIIYLMMGFFTILVIINILVYFKGK